MDWADLNRKDASCLVMRAVWYPGRRARVAELADALKATSFCYVCCVARRDLRVFFTPASLMILRPAKCFRYKDLVTADNVG